MATTDILNGVVIQSFERKFLVGRLREIRLFQRLLDGKSGDKRIVNLYGIGGMGKSFLLDEYRRIAEEKGVRFLSIDSRDFEHSPRYLCDRVNHLLDGFCPNDALVRQPLPIAEAIRKINEFASIQRLCIAFDSYEDMAELDPWIREQFIPQLHPNTVFAFGGRYPLQGAWRQSPAWRAMIAWVPLTELTYPEVQEYIRRHGICDEDRVRHIWNQTMGHPLSLSLAVYAATAGDAADADAEAIPLGPCEWLREADPDIRPLVEAASVLRHFHQEMLAYVTEQSVSDDEFQTLTRLSFVRKTERGWVLHDLVRAAIAEDMRTRMPERYTSLWNRGASYYYNRLSGQVIQQQAAAREASEAFYYLGDSFIREMFYRTTSPNDWEVVNETNAEEAERYLERRRRNPKGARIPYPRTGTIPTDDFVITPEQSLLAIEHLQATEIRTLKEAQIRLLRRASGETAGLSVVIPIGASTLDFLLRHPLSSAYFQSLTEQQLIGIRATTEQLHGVYIFGLDVEDFEEGALRADAGEHLIEWVLGAGVVVYSPPPIPFFEEALRRLGFESSGVEHYGYGKGTPASTYVLDIRGRRFQRYLRKVAQHIDLEDLQDSKGVAEDLADLTDREREIVKWIGQGLTNVEVAKRLFVSEITVKKHLTAIFQKLGIKNRTQLVRRL